MIRICPSSACFGSTYTKKRICPSISWRTSAPRNLISYFIGLFPNGLVSHSTPICSNIRKPQLSFSHVYLMSNWSYLKLHPLEPVLPAPVSGDFKFHVIMQLWCWLLLPFLHTHAHIYVPTCQEQSKSILEHTSLSSQFGNYHYKPQDVKCGMFPTMMYQFGKAFSNHIIQSSIPNIWKQHF